MTRASAAADHFARIHIPNDRLRPAADTQEPIGDVRGELLPGRSAPSSADPIYFLLHIPKTAGQTIQQHLAEHCAPGVFWRSYHKIRLGRRTSPDDLPDPARARIIAGHNITRSLENLFPGHEIRRILLLRDPLEFHVSYYNWSMMDNISKGLGTYSFDLHFRALQPNFMADFLLSRWLEIPRRARLLMADEQKYRILNQMLAGVLVCWGAHRLRSLDRGDRPWSGCASRRATSQYRDRVAGSNRMAPGDLRVAVAGYMPLNSCPKSARPSAVGALA